MKQEILEQYQQQIEEIQNINGYTIADIKRVSGYPDWGSYRRQINKYGLDISPPIDSKEYKRNQKYELLRAAFDRTGNANRISLDKARQILGCQRNKDARKILDTMIRYDLDVQALVAYTPSNQMDFDEIEEAELDARRQPEPLRVAGIVAEPIGNGWYQLR